MQWLSTRCVKLMVCRYTEHSHSGWQQEVVVAAHDSGKLTCSHWTHTVLYSHAKCKVCVCQLYATALSALVLINFPLIHENLMLHLNSWLFIAHLQPITIDHCIMWSLMPEPCNVQSIKALQIGKFIALTFKNMWTCAYITLPIICLNNIYFSCI